MMTKALWWMPPSLGPHLPEQKATTRSESIRPEEGIGGTLAKAHIGVDANGDPTA